MTADQTDTPEEGLPSPPDQPCKVVKRPPLSSLAQFRDSEFYKSQAPAAAQLKILADGFAAEQMRKITGWSIAEQIRNIVSGSLGEQMRQVEQALHPLNRIQDTIGRLAENPMRKFLDEQASKHCQMMNALRPY